MFLSQHVQQRMSERQIDSETLSAVLTHGQRRYSKGAMIYTWRLPLGSQQICVITDPSEKVIITTYTRSTGTRREARSARAERPWLAAPRPRRHPSANQLLGCWEPEDLEALYCQA